MEGSKKRFLAGGLDLLFFGEAYIISNNVSLLHWTP